jgi:carbon monoxide dehydrogenase subunit G
MKIEDSFVVAAPCERVWAGITDPATVAPCVPGCQGVEVVSPTLYRAQVRIQLGPIKANFMVEVTVIAETPPTEVRSRTRGDERSLASSLTADNLLRLRSLSEFETEVYYASEVTVVGRLGKFGLGVMQKKAAALGRDFAAAFKERVEKVGVP